MAANSALIESMIGSPMADSVPGAARVAIGRRSASHGRAHRKHSPRNVVERDPLAVPHASSFNRIDISAAMEERMGRKGTGVEIRGKAIRIQFSLNGEVVRRTFRRDGMAVPPSAENLGEATRLAAEIRSRIAEGTFCHSGYFPATSKDARPLTVGKHLDAWLAVQRIEPSTAAAYASAVRLQDVRAVRRQGRTAR
jgi:hypothetical protein